jgi:hypothetical protein
MPLLRQFENANFLKKILQSDGLDEKIVDFILLDRNQKNGSIMLIECNRQLSSDRFPMTEYNLFSIACHCMRMMHLVYSDLRVKSFFCDYAGFKGNASMHKFSV